jgi:predicted unusual protein kinase regulating ubiquinone biosynthesis (AarF/ABC1/UbiB family)
MLPAREDLALTFVWRTPKTAAMTGYVKLGQMVSTRGDLLPEAYRAELAKLQDEVAPVPAHVITEVIREDLEFSAR